MTACSYAIAASTIEDVPAQGDLVLCGAPARDDLHGWPLCTRHSYCIDRDEYGDTTVGPDLDATPPR